MFPRTIRRNTELIALLDEVGKKSKETELRVATKKRGLANTLTNRKGVVEGFKKGNLLGKKESMERDLAAWIGADPKRQPKYGGVLPALNVLQAEKEGTRERDTTLMDLLGNGSSLLPAAHTLYALSLERPKKDFDREPEYQERNWSRIREAPDRLQRSFDAVADRRLLRYILVEASKLPAGQRIEALDRETGLAPGMSDMDAGRRSTRCSIVSTRARSSATRRHASRSSTSPPPRSSRRRTR